jgi:hypothetical protein
MRTSLCQGGSLTLSVYIMLHDRKGAASNILLSGLTPCAGEIIGITNVDFDIMG